MRRIKKGDQVVVLSGKDKGKRGAVVNIFAEEKKIIVENVNIAHCHVKGNPMQGKPGGIVKKEMPVHISNIALWNPITDKPDRVGFRFLKDGQKVRYFKSNDEIITNV